MHRLHPPGASKPRLSKFIRLLDLARVIVLRGVLLNELLRLLGFLSLGRRLAAQLDFLGIAALGGRRQLQCGNQLFRVDGIGQRLKQLEWSQPPA